MGDGGDRQGATWEEMEASEPVLHAILSSSLDLLMVCWDSWDLRSLNSVCINHPHFASFPEKCLDYLFTE